MRDVKTSLGVAQSQKLRTTNALSKTKEEIVHLESVTERRVEQVLEKEKRRFAAQEASIKKSRHRLLKAREKLAMTINKNRALTELRRQLQQARWEGNDPVVPKVGIPALEQNPRQIELRY